MARSLAALLLLNRSPLPWQLQGQAQHQDDSVATAFFLSKDLHPGSKMTLHFTLAAAGAAALPRASANAIPFTSTRIPEILSRLSVPAGSTAAGAVRSTLAACEAAPVPGVEALRCVTSPDSMVDLAAASLGTRNIRAAATKLITSTEEAGGATTPRQEYTMVSVRPVPVAGGDMVACHCMPYPYAVFACHATTAAVYTVSLAGADGTTAKGEALAACHADAFPGISGSAYKKLGVEPGSVPLCHFLPQDSMLWMRK